MNATKLGRLTLLGLLGLALSASAALAKDFIYPVGGRVTSTYYSQRSYGRHAALDLAGNNGKAIGAAAAGRVIHAGVAGDYGKLVIVDHGGGFRTYYAHMSSIAVGVGRNVSTNQVLGYVGSTGHSTGPHLHFEVRKSGVKQAFPPYSLGVWVTRGVRIPKNF